MKKLKFLATLAILATVTAVTGCASSSSTVSGDAASFNTTSSATNVNTNNQSVNPQTMSRSITTHHETTIVIKHNVGNIHIIQWNKPVVAVSGSVYTADSADTNYQSLIKSLSYSLTTDGMTVSVVSKTLPKLDDYPAEMDLTIYVPESIGTIQASVQNGIIRAEADTVSNVEFTATSGMVLATFLRLNPNGHYALSSSQGTYVTIPHGTNIRASNGVVWFNFHKLSVAVPKAQLSNQGPSFGCAASSQPVQVITAPAKDSKLQPRQMKADLNAVSAKLQNQPNYWLGLGQIELQQAYQEIKQPMTPEQFYMAMDRLFVSFEDGHTRLFPFGGDGIELPPLTWTANGWIVNEADGPFEVGDKIVTLAGVSPKSLLVKLRDYVPAEHDGWIQAESEEYLGEGWLDRALGLVNSKGQVPVVIERAGQQQSVNLPVTSFNPWYGVFHTQRSFVPATYTIDSTRKIGVLQIHECTTSADYEQVLKSFFQNVKKDGVQNVVVDLRDNGGGDDRATALFLKYISVADTLGYMATYPVIEKEKVAPELKFHGHVYVLTSSQTFSSATDFAVELQAFHIGKIVGQPTGNNVSYCGNVVPFLFSNGGFTAMIPTTHNLAPGVPDDAQSKPITPDVPITIKRSDVANGTDVWMQAVYKFIDQS